MYTQVTTWVGWAGWLSSAACTPHPSVESQGSRPKICSLAITLPQGLQVVCLSLSFKDFQFVVLTKNSHICLGAGNLFLANWPY